MALYRVEDTEFNLDSLTPEVPVEFGYESEHPAISLPFSVAIRGKRFDGNKISLTSMSVASHSEIHMVPGSKHVASVQFEFQNFSVTIYPEVVVAGEKNGDLNLTFADPTGDHVAHLRFVLNSFIAGDFVTLGSVMAYSGPTKPKEAKAETQQNWKERARSMFVAFLSAMLAFAALYAFYVRFTTGYEMHPVVIERAGQPMQATTAGQIAFLDPSAGAGEVLFSINSNTGDILNFRMPCDCEVILTDGIREGVTVLPTDIVASILKSDTGIEVETLMSVEGFSRAMRGDRVFLDLTDGRSIPVQIMAKNTSNAAAISGEVFIPVRLQAEDGLLSEADIGKYGQLRLRTAFFGN